MSEKTEWEDILVKRGLIKATPKKVTEDEVHLKMQEAEAAVDKLDRLSLDDLDEQEDDLDDEVLRQYRARRIAELKAKMSKNKFGEVYSITEKEYKKEVTEASKEGEGVWVFLHLYVFGKLECRLLNKHMETTAKRFKSVKFCKIVGRDCIRGYPDSKCPTIIIYHKGEIFKQIVGLTDFGGKRMTDKTLTWTMIQWKMIDASMEKNPFDDLNSINVTRRGRGGVAKRSAYDSDDSEDDVRF